MDSEEDRKFENKDELKTWLVESRGVHDKFAIEVAGQLFQDGFIMPSTLLNCTLGVFKNFPMPIAMHLSNKLSNNKKKKNDDDDEQQMSKKKLRRTVVDELKKLDIQELVDPLEYPQLEPTGPSFVCQDGWLDEFVGKVIDLCKKGDAVDGSYRVQMTSLARCSRGGKTRALLELAKALRDRCVPTIFVSFNDFSDCSHEIDDGHSSLDMLCRRIAFAVRPARLRTGAPADDFKLFRNSNISSDEISSFLSDRQVILLIDELNKVKMDRNLALFLKENFLVQPGRYYVFSSHLSSTNPEKALSSVSMREMNVETLPLIEDVSNARQSLEITDLTPRMALFFGRIPSLLVTHLTVEGLSCDTKIVQRVENVCEGMSLDVGFLYKVLPQGGVQTSFRSVA